MLLHGQRATLVLKHGAKLAVPERVSEKAREKSEESEIMCGRAPLAFHEAVTGGSGSRSIKGIGAS